MPMSVNRAVVWYIMIFWQTCSLIVIRPPLCQAPWPQGTECVARYNFKGTSEQDLPFNKGDVLTIIVVTKVIKKKTAANKCSF